MERERERVWEKLMILLLFIGPFPATVFSYMEDIETLSEISRRDQHLEWRKNMGIFDAFFPSLSLSYQDKPSNASHPILSHQPPTSQFFVWNSANHLPHSKPSSSFRNSVLHSRI